MLVIAGAPSLAVAAECDPCPPDCPMMAVAADQGDRQDHPASDGPQDLGAACQQVIACQSAAALHAPLASGPAPSGLQAAAEHERLLQPPPRSQPPDETLRPPIWNLLFV